MASNNHRSVPKIPKGILAAALLCIAAYVCRFLPSLVPGDPEGMKAACGAFRDLVYIGIPVGWTISVGRRVIQQQIRRYLVCIGSLLVLWILLRTAKYRLDLGFYEQSMLWYLYYLPMLFIPTLSFLAFMSMGRPEGFKLPPRFHLVLAHQAVLLALTLTNNLTQWAFVFLTDPPSTVDVLYRRSFVYYADMAWIAAMVVACVVALVRRSKLLTPRQEAAIISLLGAMSAYLVLYVVFSDSSSLIHRLAGDVSVVASLFTMAVLELCLRFRIIQNNTHYQELFSLMDIPAAILDSEGGMLCSSSKPSCVSKARMLEAIEAPVDLGGGKRHASRRSGAQGEGGFHRDAQPALRQDGQGGLPCDRAHRRNR